MAYSQSYWESEENRVLGILSRSNLTQAQRESNQRELAVIQLNLDQFEENTKPIPQTVVINQVSYPVSQAPSQPSYVQEAIQQMTYTPQTKEFQPPQTFTSTTTTTTTTPNVSELQGEDDTLLNQIQRSVSQIGSIFGLVGDIPANFVGGVTNVLPYVSQDILTTSQNLGGVIPNIVIPSVSQIPVALGTGLGTGLEQLGTGLGGGLQQLLTGTGTGLGTGLGTALAQTGTGLGTGLQETGTGLGAGLKDLILPVAILGGAYLLLKNA